MYKRRIYIYIIFWRYKFFMSLYLWHRRSTPHAFSILFFFIVLFCMGSLILYNRSMEAIGAGDDYIDIEIIQRLKQSRDSDLIKAGGGAPSAHMFIGSVIILFWLGINLQSVGGGRPIRWDRGAIVFRISCSVVFAIIVEGVITRIFYWVGILLPAGSPAILAIFIVLIELLRSTIRTLTLGIRILANLLVGLILLFIWIRFFSISYGFYYCCLSGRYIRIIFGVLYRIGFLFFSFAFVYERLVYLFQAFLYGRLLSFYQEEISVPYRFGIRIFYTNTINNYEYKRIWRNCSGGDFFISAYNFMGVNSES